MEKTRNSKTARKFLFPVLNNLATFFIEKWILSLASASLVISFYISFFHYSLHHWLNYLLFTLQGGVIFIFSCYAYKAQNKLSRYAINFPNGKLENIKAKYGLLWNIKTLDTFCPSKNCHGIIITTIYQFPNEPTYQVHCRKCRKDILLYELDNYDLFTSTSSNTPQKISYESALQNMKQIFNHSSG